MPDEIQRVPLLYNGVSQQPPNIRLQNQVEDATNANFTVVEGLTRRSGSWVQQHVADGLLPAANNRLHPIVRDETERYIVIHNRTGSGSTIKVLDLSNNKYATVIISTNAQTYLDSASPDQFRFRTIVDVTLILNTDANVAGDDDAGTIDSTKMPMAMTRTKAAAGPKTITANTAANPTVITCVGHGLVSGQVIEITGSNSTPTIDGTRTITYIDDDHFSVAVNVTVAGTTGTFYSRALFNIAEISWNARSNGAKTITAITSEHQITNITVANPTQVQSNAHGLQTGDTVTISGSDSTPDIDGDWYVTRLNANYFSVNENVTVAGSAGTFQAGPAHVTSASHGLGSGDTIRISGSDSVPSIDGVWVVTVLDANTFTIPSATITTNGTAGSFSTRNYGTSLTNPLPKLWNEGRKISDIIYWRQRLGFLGDERVTLSQTNDLYNFWIQDVGNIVDSDPIDVALSSTEVTILDFGIPIRDSVILFTKAGKQFDLFAADALTPSTVKVKPITGYRTLSARPAVSDPSIYFGCDQGGYLTLMEYTYDEVTLLSKAEDVSAHVPKFMPLTTTVPAAIGVYTADPSMLRTIEVSPEHGVVFVLIRDKVVNGEVFGNRIYAYRNRFIKQDEVQRAWTRWEIARTGSTTGIRGIHDICVIGNHLYALVHCGTGSPPDFFIIRISIPTEPDNEDPPTPETQ